MTPTDQILLATYNGEKFLREQIDSVLAQQDVSLHILARDDGSTDNTLAILREYAQRLPGQFHLLEDGAGTGNAKWNFIKLTAASTASYVCFCDQDDIWLPNKVSRSLALMRELEAKHTTAVPMLVFTDLVVIDEAGAAILPSFWQRDQIDPEAINQLNILIGHNVVTGCTAMLNRRCADLTLRMPDDSPMHDRWAGLIVACMGNGAFLPDKLVRYRQHGGNVIGAPLEKVNFWTKLRWPKTPEKRLEQWWINQRVAAALLSTYPNEMPASSRNILETYVRIGREPNRWLRVYLLLRHNLLRNGLRRKLSTLWDVFNLGIH